MALLDSNLINQLKEVFKRLTSEVKIVNFVDEANEKSLELKSFLDEFAAVSDKVVIENVDTKDNRYDEFGIDKLPALAFVNANGEFTGGKFHGIPGGHEINSFVLTILNTAGIGRSLDSDVSERVDNIDKNLNLKVFVTLACHHCPDVVVATQQIALNNDKVEAQMIDIALFPELAEQAGVKSVPTVIYNDDKMTIGSKNINEILDKIEETIK